MVEIVINSDGTLRKAEANIKRTVERKVSEATRKKEEKVKAYRREASRLAAMANKRVQRLEKNSLKDSPAYQGYLKSGGGKFSVKGKTHNQLQSEVARMRAFIDARTSTISGTNSYLKEIAQNTGIKYSNMVDLRKKSSKFFELASKVEQYLRTVHDMASAIGYQKIWEAVNVYTQKTKTDLAAATTDVDSMIAKISEALAEHQRPEEINLDSIAFLNGGEWFTLPKE